MARRAAGFGRAALAVLRLAARAPCRLHAFDAQPDRHDDHLRPVVQHADGPGRAAVVLPFGAVRACRLFHRAFPQRRRRRRAAGADGTDAAARRVQRARLRHRVRLHGDQAALHRIRHDHARHRPACHHRGDDVPPLLRRRGRREDRPRDRQQPVRPRIRPVDRGLLPDRRLDDDRRRRHVFPHHDAARPHGECLPRQPRAGAVRRLRSAHRALPAVRAVRLLCRHRRRAVRHHLRDRHLRCGRRAAGGECAADGLYRRRHHLLRPGARRDPDHAAAERRQPDVELLAGLCRRAVHRDGDVRADRPHRHRSGARADRARRPAAPAGAALSAHPGPRADHAVRLRRAGGTAVVPHDRQGAGQAPRAVRPRDRHLRHGAVAGLAGLPAGRRLLARARSSRSSSASGTA